MFSRAKERLVQQYLEAGRLSQQNPDGTSRVTPNEVFLPAAVVLAAKIIETRKGVPVYQTTGELVEAPAAPLASALVSKFSPAGAVRGIYDHRREIVPGGFSPEQLVGEVRSIGDGSPLKRAISLFTDRVVADLDGTLEDISKRFGKDRVRVDSRRRPGALELRPIDDLLDAHRADIEATVGNWPHRIEKTLVVPGVGGPDLFITGVVPKIIDPPFMQYPELGQTHPVNAAFNNVARQVFFGFCVPHKGMLKEGVGFFRDNSGSFTALAQQTEIGMSVAQLFAIAEMGYGKGFRKYNVLSYPTIPVPPMSEWHRW